MQETPTQLINSHSTFLFHFGIPIDTESQDIPFYTAIAKMHKTPPDNRYISSSACSSVNVASVWLNRLFNALLPEIDKLSASVMKEAGMKAQRAHRSWILKNSVAAMPLLQVWNQLYSSASASASSAEPPLCRPLKSNLTLSVYVPI